MRLVLTLAVVSGLSALVGCAGPNCQDTCRRIYGSSTGECSIAVPGQSESDLIQTCMSRCENALDQPGELGSYDPNTRNTSGQTVTLENERQAAEWMDCVALTDCEQLDNGFCEPI